MKSSNAPSKCVGQRNPPYQPPPIDNSAELNEFLKWWMALRVQWSHEHLAKKFSAGIPWSGRQLSSLKSTPEVSLFLCRCNHEGTHQGISMFSFGRLLPHLAAQGLAAPLVALKELEVRSKFGRNIHLAPPDSPRAVPLSSHRVHESTTSRATWRPQPGAPWPRRREVGHGGSWWVGNLHLSAFLQVKVNVCRVYWSD